MKYIVSVALALITGCSCGCVATREHYAVAATSTIIGVELSQNAATQTPQGKVGYNRSELAIVPTNRGTKDVDAVGGGAADSAEVIMELEFSRMLSTNGGIRQRLAVGKTAVSSVGAAYMLAKKPDGTVDAETAAAIQGSFASIPVTTSESVDRLFPLTEAYAKSESKALFDAVAIELGHESFVDWAQDDSLSPADIKRMGSALKLKNLI